jgi:DNA-binding NarL/FixJ family response regulator
MSGVGGEAGDKDTGYLSAVTATVGEAPEVSEVVVLVADPAHRSRLRAALEVGPYRTVLPPQILTWAAARRPQVLLVTDDSERTATLRAAIMTVAPEAACVVLVDEPTPARYRQLLTSCLAVLPTTASGPDLLAAVTAAGRYLTCLPGSAAQALTGGEGPRPGFSNRELGLLQELADGAKVASLARTAGYSQREMYRVLAELYERLGASTRTEALLRADRWGLLNTPTASTVSGDDQTGRR